MAADLFGEKVTPFWATPARVKGRKIPRAPVPAVPVPSKTWTAEERAHAARIRGRQQEEFCVWALEELARWEKHLPAKEFAIMRASVLETVQRMRGGA